MKKRVMNFENGVWCMIAFLVVCMAISFYFEKAMSTNTASIIGGALSAIATIFVGLFAIWQNSRYEKMTDKANDIQVRPEFFVVFYSPW
jgi:ABC-type nickel/cobalt efflux system permease component RcnA